MTRTATVAAVNVKLPSFWPAHPEVWFALVEAQFTTRGITVQKTWFDYIVASLSPKFASEVHDLILKPPGDHPYDTLKTQLIKQTAASEQRKLQQLFNAEELGDRKPTQLLCRMQQLLGDKTGAPDSDGTFLCELFLQRLPATVHMVLASTDESLTLDKLAELADKVMEVATPSVSATATPQVTTEVEQLRTEVTRLQEMVKSRNSADNQPPTPGVHLALSAPARLQIPHFAGTTRNLVKSLTSVGHLAPKG